MNRLFLTVLGGGTTQNIAFPNGTATITPFTGRNTFTINVPVVYMGRYEVVLRGDYP